MKQENIYWSRSIKYKEIIEKITKTIFQVYGNELILKMEELNLLQNENSTIESSTAIGYCMEEFLVSKLMTYTSQYSENTLNKFQIKKPKISTQNCSYDFCSEIENELFLVNIKAEKNGNSNDAIAAINKLYSDYVEQKPDTVKHYMILKIKYSLQFNKNHIRKIFIDGIEIFFLEEFLFENWHQDSRNWSPKFNPNSGRLKIDPDKQSKQIEISKISYENTKKEIKYIYKYNQKITENTPNDN